MMHPTRLSRKVKFTLLDNAATSLMQAVQLLAWKDIGTDHTRLKHAISHAAHSVELLLKERLRRINPAFVWKNVDKFPSLDAETVNTNTAISRLTTVGGVIFSDKDVVMIESLRRARNAIEHYEWETTEKDARLIVANALSFTFSFAKSELDIDLSSVLKTDDTWSVLLNELNEFNSAHGARLEASFRAQGVSAVECDECGAQTVPWQGGACELCGHWQSMEDDEELCAATGNTPATDSD